MLYVNKNKLFIPFLSKFAGPPLMERKAHNQGIIKELMGLIKEPKGKAQSLAQIWSRPRISPAF